MQKGEPSKMGQLMDYHSPDSATITKQMDCYWTHVWNMDINKLPCLNTVRLGNNKQ